MDRTDSHDVQQNAHGGVDTARQTAQEILGYLNLSSGTSDPRFLAGMNVLFAWIASTGPEGVARHRLLGEQPAADPNELTWRTLGRLLRAELQRLHGSSTAFARVEQAEAVVELVFHSVLPAYRQHHRDLLFHQTEESLFQPLFIGRVCEAVLAQGGPWDQTDRITHGAVKRLNDFIGHRPVAVLRSAQKIQPYDHERVRPIPLYIREAGVQVGRYQPIVEKALEILRAADPDLLREAWFRPDLLDELAVDPRAYDFDHPVNHRPNYCFGQWDPHLIDNRGYYRRFVLQQVTLDGILDRVDHAEDLPKDEALVEAAAVLAGTMLMGSGVSGDGPQAHDSDTTLATLLPQIAQYRDRFYEEFLAGLTGAHGRRLRAEAKRLRQPLGGARQALNQLLARYRANQLQHVHLAELYARMGYTDAAVDQAQVVPVASARMRCEIHCRLSAASQAIQQRRLDDAAADVPIIQDLLHRAIQCGAMVDPWNILGFGGQFSLFPSIENSQFDHRVEELIQLMGEIFDLIARLEQEAAAAGKNELQQKLSDELEKLAQWWDQFATTEVGGISGISGRQVWQSADHVAKALGAWHQAGTAAGDIAFWREHVEQFRSPEAYALVVDALLERHDSVSSMALLMQWLSQSEQTPAAEGGYSFHHLALRWMESLWQPPGESKERLPQTASPAQRWQMARKFLDYLEAGSEELGEVPHLELAGQPAENQADPRDEDDEADEGGLFNAAYENVTFRDSADDGFEGETLEGSYQLADFELAGEADRITHRLAFLKMLAQLWRLTAALSADVDSADRDDVLAGWARRAEANYQGLLRLLGAVHRYQIPPSGTASAALLEYDQRQAVKETLLERVVTTCVETEDARRLILATTSLNRPTPPKPSWEDLADDVLHALYAGDVLAIRRHWPKLIALLAQQPLLYQPSSKGGSPRRIVASRSLQEVLRRLLAGLPRLGLVGAACELIETVQRMEQDHPVGPGAITEFHEMFDIAYRAIVRCLVASVDHSGSLASDQPLVKALEQISEPLVYRWVSHSRRIRLSVLQTVAAPEPWHALKKFITSYGQDLFTQQFMHFSNLRAIVHQGVGEYLRRLADDDSHESSLRLLEDLDRRIPREEAVRWLGVAIEAVMEYYIQYMDYNSTTTQSDRGEMLYTLLDFLRLLASYDRTAWQLQPLLAAHEVLIEEGRNVAAARWQREITDRTAELADDHLARYERLCQQYGMRLPSVADRLGQRFVQPLAIDWLRSLVRPAVEERERGAPIISFQLLDAEVKKLTAEPAGVGFEVPEWLETLEDELDHVLARTSGQRDPLESYPRIPQIPISLEELLKQVADWAEGRSPRRRSKRTKDS